jgi:hypothetical protein
MSEAEIIEQILAHYRSSINSTPALLSLLYDVDLLPEQITTIRDAKSMAAVVEAYKLLNKDVKPLDFSNCLKHAFLSGVVAARNILEHEPCDGPTLWTNYEPYVPGSYSRVTTALSRTTA